LMSGSGPCDGGRRMESPKVTPGPVYAASAVLLAVITWTDYVTGYELGLFVLYFIPVALTAWWGSRRAGLAFAIAAALCWYASDRLARHPYPQAFLIYWETFMRFVSYLTTALTLSRIREGMRRQEDLLRVVSHDLRAPLTALSGQAQILRSRAGSDPWIAARGDAIIRAANRMDSMIADLVDGARQADGQLRLDLQPIELQGYLAELMSRMHEALEGDRVELALATRPPLVVKADPGRLERVFVNLISNALKYSPADSRIKVDAEGRNGQVIVSISDHGSGIAPEDAAHLFERYYRGRAAQEQPGLGLGLYSTRLLVEAHGGRITVENAPDGGATFRFGLPAA
jgi:NtrC-family two-component system sensor histidine kinase KinB